MAFESTHWSVKYNTLRTMCECLNVLLRHQLRSGCEAHGIQMELRHPTVVQKSYLLQRPWGDTERRILV